MNFFISNHKKLANKFGKWFYYTDDLCKVIRHNGKISIYHGYLIDKEKTLEDLIVSERLEHNLNGNFFVVTLSENGLQVFVDYFAQHKLLYRNDGDRFEITNKIFLFPLSAGDIDHKKMHQRITKSLEHNYLKILQTENPVEKYKNRRGTGQGHNFPVGLSGQNETRSDTIFNHVKILPPYHSLEFENKVIIERTVDLKEQIHESLFGTHKDKIDQDYIYNCMLEHSEIVKRNYKNIASSVSEGIDSVLQDSFFPEVKKITYSYDPPATTTKYKEDYLCKFNTDMVEWKHFKVSNQVAMAEQYTNDPETDYFDTLPTTWQVNKYCKDTDVVLYGQLGDSIFLHQPWYLYTHLMGTLYDNKNTSMKEKFTLYQEQVKKYADCYSARETLGGPEFHLYYSYFSVEDFKTFEKNIELVGRDWKNNFSQACVPSTYTRDLIHSCDKQMVSLYADKRFFHAIHKADTVDMLSNISDAKLQKDILKNKFHYDFITPGKDGAWFNMHEMIKPWYKNTISHCMKDHL